MVPFKYSVTQQAYNSKHICTKCKIHTVQAHEYIRSNVPFRPPIESREHSFKQADVLCLLAFTLCIIHSLLFSYRSTVKFHVGPLADMWEHVKRLFSFRTDIPRCAFPGFELFLLLTLCCHGDGEITDVKSWNLGPQETFIIVLGMKCALVPRFCRG